ncbi:hypothetical protein [Gorillibacterium sp. CAU 1737]|uniref:hypothetical protein n=1 Tax=Gorillibacterium sp. CAU 1737 TaxID=3140362 RepID=UPI00325FE1BF
MFKELKALSSGFGLIVTTLTFPGVIVHELAHQLMCHICKLKVYAVRYFYPIAPCGYVIHEATDDPRKLFLVATGPFFINSGLGAIVVLPAITRVMLFSDSHNPLMLVLAWLGISILMHAFPSKADAKTMMQGILKNKKVGIVPKLLTAPVVGLIYLGAIGSVYWLDLIYAVAVARILPDLLVRLF